MLRCWVPTCTTRLFSFWAAMTALPSLRSWVNGFSTYTSLPALHASTVIGTCQWSGVAISTASTSLRASSSSCFFVANALGSASFFAASRLVSHTSHTAVILTFGNPGNDFSRCLHRPPTPMRPTCRVSFAAKPREVSVRSVPAATADEARNVRRSVVMGEAPGVRSRETGIGRQESGVSNMGKHRIRARVGALCWLFSGSRSPTSDPLSSDSRLPSPDPWKKEPPRGATRGGRMKANHPLYGNKSTDVPGRYVAWGTHEIRCEPRRIKTGEHSPGE